MGYFSGGGAPTSSKRTFFEDDGTLAAPLESIPGEAPYTLKAATNKKDLAEALHRLHAAGDTKSFNEIAAQAGSVFTPEDIKKFGLDKYGQGEGNGKSWLSRFKHNAGQVATLGSDRVGGWEAKGLGVLDRPSKRSLTVLGSLRRGHFGQAAESLGLLLSGIDVLPNAVTGKYSADAQLKHENFDKDSDGQVNFREVLGMDPDAGGSGWKGKAIGALDTAAVAATDPTNYITFGGSTLAKSGMKAIGAEFGEDMVRKIGQNGLDGALKKGLITELEHEAIQNTLHDASKELVKSAAKKRSVRKLVEKEGEESAAKILADESYEAVRKSGRSGLRVGVGESKRTLIPSNIGGKSLVPGLQAKYAWQAGGERAATNAVADAIAAVEKAPPATDAGGFAKAIAEKMIPVEPGMHVIDDAASGGKVIGLRGEDGALHGYMMLTDDAVNTFENVGGPRGTGQRLLQAAQDAGVDMPKLLANSDFTDKGRTSALSWLSKQSDAAVDLGARTSAPTRRTALGALRETKGGARLREMFVTRAGTTSKFGASVADKVYGAVETAAAKSGRNINDMMIQVAHVSNEAAKEFKEGAGEKLTALLPDIAGRTGKDASNDVLLGVLEGTLDSAAVKAALEADGMSAAVKAVEAFEDVAAHQDAAITAAKGAVAEAPAGIFDGLVEPAVNKGGRLARILTPEGEALAKGEKQAAMTELFGASAKDLKQGTDMTDALSTVAPDIERTTVNSLGQPIQTLGKDTAALSGKTYADMPIRELNEAMVKRLSLPEGTKLFVDDALTGVALRGKSAFQAAAQVDIFEQLAKESINGEPLVSILRPTDGLLKREAFMKLAKDKGWVQLNNGEGKKLALGEVWGPKEIMGDLSKMHDMIVNDESLKAFSNFLNKWNGMWASYATVPVVFGTNFHSRNSIGNVILAFMGGLTNPQRFAKAAELQWGVARTRALMKKEGLNFEEALVKQVKSERSRQLIRDMRDHGIISNGFFADISGDEVENVLRHNSLKDWMNPKKIPARLNDNQLIRSGRKVGDVVENNARVALYMDAFEKMGHVQNAANHVKKYLFDYQDLTPFERRYMKSANRFYTFTRKNVAVQMYTLAHDPWRIHMANKLEGMLYDPQGTEDASLPEYARKGGFGITRLLGKPAGTDGVGMNIDTPWDNAMKTLDPIVQGISMMPGLREVVPPEYRSDKGELAKSIIGLRAGGPVEFVNFLMEQATGKDLYSGKDITNESSGDTFQRLANAFVPLYSKGETFSKSASNPLKALPDSVPGGGGKFGEDPSHPGMNARLSLMQSLVGFQVLPITDKQQNQVAFAGAQEAMDALAELKAEGVDVPTYTDLVELGLAPDLRAKKPYAKKQTSEQVAAGRVSKLQAARRATGATPLEIPKQKAKPSSGSKSYF